MITPPNGFRKAVKVSIGLCALGAALVMWAFLHHGEDALDPVHPEPFFAGRLAVGAGLVIVGSICAFYFRICAKDADRLASGEQALAQWALTAAEQQAFANAVYEREHGAQPGALIALGLLVGIALIMQIIARLDWAFFLWIVLGLLLIWGITGFVMPKLVLWRMLRQENPSAAIGLRMGFVLGAHALWPHVECVKLERGEAVHIMTIQHMQQTWEKHTSPLPVQRETRYTAYVPVPLDRYDEGAMVARRIAEAAEAELVLEPIA